MADEKLTFIGHLEELRRCIFKSIIFVAVVSCLSYTLVDIMMPHLIRPVGRLVFLAPHEAFMSRIKIALFTGILFSSPYLIYQAWSFARSGLRERERKHVLIFGPLSFIFFISGAAFGYFVIVPIGLGFLLGFASELITPMISISKYISFLGMLTLTFGLVFELPLASLFLTRIGVITPGFLAARRREAIVLIFIVAAILTPPDVITQCLMAVPLVALYEIGIMLSKMVYRKK